jgi:hypothetical protein
MSRLNKRVAKTPSTKESTKKQSNYSKHSEVDVVLNASFIKAWNTHRPTDYHIGFSDAQTRV